MFATRLKEARKNAGMSQEELAALYNEKFNGGLNKGTLSKYENGLQSPSAKNRVPRLAEILGVTTDYLLGSSDIQTTNRAIVSELPQELEGMAVGFHDGAFDGLDEDDMEMLKNMAEHLRSKKRGRLDDST